MYVFEPTNEPDDPRSKDPYFEQLYSCIPLYTTRLVREGNFPFPSRKQVTTPEGVAAVLQEYFAAHDREEVVLVLLDAAGTATGLSRLSIGGLTHSVVEPRQVFKTAVLANAASIILAHNHPSGNPKPSKEDVKLTRQVAEAGKLMGIPLRDHLIITADGFTSLARRGLIK